MKRKEIAVDALLDLRRRLQTLPLRSPERRRIMHETAELYGVSEATLYRALRERTRPQALQRTDKGKPRVLPPDQMERYCEVIAVELATCDSVG